jgi:hypothetical protein
MASCLALLYSNSSSNANRKNLNIRKDAVPRNIYLSTVTISGQMTICCQRASWDGVIPG